MANYITTHDSSGNAIFSSTAQGKRTKLEAPIGNMEMLYTTHSIPTNVASETDIDQFSKDARDGLGHRLCPEGGTAAAILNITPNSESPFHRTMTLDIFVVLEGALELHLDSGEKRTLSAGDCAIQRAVMHKWVNVTPDDGWAKAIAIAQPIVEPLQIGGKKLDTEFVF